MRDSFQAKEYPYITMDRTIQQSEKPNRPHHDKQEMENIIAGREGEERARREQRPLPCDWEDQNEAEED